MRLKMVEFIISVTLAEVFGQYAYILEILYIIHHIWAQRACGEYENGVCVFVMGKNGVLTFETV